MKSPIFEESPPALRPPTKIDAEQALANVGAVEKLRKQWKEEGEKKRYPFEWVLGFFTPLPLLVYLLWQYRRLREHVDLLLTSRVKELEEKEEKVKIGNSSESNETPEETAAV